MAYFQKSKLYFLKSKPYFFESKPNFEKQAFSRLWLFIFGTVFPAGEFIKGTGIWKKKADRMEWNGIFQEGEKYTLVCLNNLVDLHDTVCTAK